MRWRRDLVTGKLTIEWIHLVTSLPPGTATGSELAAAPAVTTGAPSPPSD